MTGPEPDCIIPWSADDFETIRVFLYPGDLKGRRDEICSAVGKLSADNGDVQSLKAALEAFASQEKLSVQLVSEPDRSDPFGISVNVAFRPPDLPFEVDEATEQMIRGGSEGYSLTGDK